MNCYFCEKEIFYVWSDERYSACEECLKRFGFVMERPAISNSTMKEICVEQGNHWDGFYYDSLAEMWGKGE